MFDIAPSELMLVAVVALVVIGPKDLPRAMRFVGQWVGRARGMAHHFRAGFDEMVRQAELEEMEKHWAAENARIMAEHPAVPPEEADDAEQAAALSAPAYAMTPLASPSAAEELIAIETRVEPASQDAASPPPVHAPRRPEDWS